MCVGSGTKEATVATRTTCEPAELGVILRWRDAILRIDACEPGSVRVRKHPGDEAPVSPLVRYGFFRDDWPEARVELSAARCAWLGAPEERTLRFVVRGIRKPRRVALNGTELVGPDYGQAAFWVHRGDALGIAAGRRPAREATAVEITW